jgi:hypothetical protein
MTAVAAITINGFVLLFVSFMLVLRHILFSVKQ